MNIDENSTRQAAETYFASWRERDFTRFRTALADDVDFLGPFGHVVGGDECTTAMQGLARITTDVVVLHRFVDGADVLTWFELHTKDADPIPVANWSHVEDGRITRIRVTFDPRPLGA
jgi:SnoaL-like domain